MVLHRQILSSLAIVAIAEAIVMRDSAEQVLLIGDSYLFKDSEQSFCV